MKKFCMLLMMIGSIACSSIAFAKSPIKEDIKVTRWYYNIPSMARQANLDCEQWRKEGYELVELVETPEGNKVYIFAKYKFSF